MLGQFVSRAGQLVSASSRTGQGVVARRAVETPLNGGFAPGSHARTRLRTAGLIALGRAAARLATLTTGCAAVLGNDPSCREQQNCEQQNFRHIYPPTNNLNLIVHTYTRCTLAVLKSIGTSLYGNMLSVSQWVM